MACKNFKCSSAILCPSTTRTLMLSIIAGGLAFMLGAPLAHGQCGGQAGATAPPGCVAVNDVVTLVAKVGTTAEDGGTVTSARLQLACSLSGGCGGCITDSPVPLQYLGDATIDQSGLLACTGITITSDHPLGTTTENEVNFTFTPGIHLAADTICTFRFNVKVSGYSNDATPGSITGNFSQAGTCDSNPELDLSGCGSYAIKVQPSCFTSGDNQICEDSTTTFCANPVGGTPPYIVVWRDPSNAVIKTCLDVPAGGTCCTDEISTPGVYTATVMDNSECTSTCTRTLTVGSDVTCTPTGNNSICAGSTTSFCSAPTGGTAPYTVVWKDPADVTIKTCNAVAAGGTCCTDAISAPGIYTANVTDANNCTGSCTRTLTVNPVPLCTITGGEETICAGDSTQWCGPLELDAYAWTASNGGVIPAGQADDPCITISTAGTYCLVTTDNGCNSTATCCRTLIVNPIPPCNITGGLETICTGASTQWCGPPNMDEYFWTASNGGVIPAGQEDDPCITISTAGTYCLETTDNDCGSTATCCRTLSVSTCAPTGCRVTGGGNNVITIGNNKITFGGQAGAPLTGCCGDSEGDQQPWGEWTHQQHKGSLGDFTFHGGTASSPDDALITCIRCMDPVACHPANNPAGFKQIEFDGVGSMKSVKVAPPGSGFVKGGLHAFEVHIDDLGEPGGGHGNELPGCPSDGVSFPAEFDHCSCPDFYRIRIHADCSLNSPVVYEVFGYTDGGNFQIHEPTGSHKQSRCGQQTCGEKASVSSDSTVGGSSSLCGSTAAAALAPLMLLGYGFMRRNARRALRN